jgi:hypothetical protein
MIVGGKIENRKNLMDKDGPVPGEYRGQPVVDAQTLNVKTGRLAPHSAGYAAPAQA